MNRQLLKLREQLLLSVSYLAVHRDRFVLMRSVQNASRPPSGRFDAVCG